MGIDRGIARAILAAVKAFNALKGHVGSGLVPA